MNGFYHTMPSSSIIYEWRGKYYHYDLMMYMSYTKKKNSKKEEQRKEI